MNMINWIGANFGTVEPSKELASRAIRHLKKLEKRLLFSSDISQMRAAEGRWYEALIYEIMLDISVKSDFIQTIVRKGADAPFPPLEVKLGQNGLFYSNRGDVKIRGNGQDIAEVDMLLVDYNGLVAFAEIVTSPSDLRALEDEVHYKKRLLGYLFGQVHVPFILFSSVDISRSSIVQRVIKEPDSVLVVTRTCEELKRLLKIRDIRGNPRKPIRHKKLRSLPEIQPRRPYDYKALHDLHRERLLDAVRKGASGTGVCKDLPPLVKKVLFGAPYPSAIKTLCTEVTFQIKGRTLTCEDMVSDYAKVVIAVDLPSLEPIVYLRLKKEAEYLKMIPDRSGGFRFESRRNHRMKGFFLWLESIEPTFDAKLSSEIVAWLLKKPYVKNSHPAKGR
ncbi:MAG: hypothetical protein JXA08_07935 [Methanomicrobiaceae archaeon]|nr:hypothetical protein [Methanomicrobiaceae archaeon]